MKQDLVNKISSGFKTYNDMFSLLKNGDYSFLSRECGTNNYPEIKWMIDYFLENEEYEKCNYLSKLKLAQASSEKLDKEVKWLLKMNKIMIENKQQTAVEWYDNEIGKLFNQFIVDKITIYEFRNQQLKLKSQAKAMHKEEIIQAVNFADNDPLHGIDAEQYYNETFGGNNEQQ